LSNSVLYADRRFQPPGNSAVDQEAKHRLTQRIITKIDNVNNLKEWNFYGMLVTEVTLIVAHDSEPCSIHLTCIVIFIQGCG
jgi:hypothetical protein